MAVLDRCSNEWKPRILVDVDDPYHINPVTDESAHNKISVKAL